MCTFLTLQRSNELGMQSQLEGVPRIEVAALQVKLGCFRLAACRSLLAGWTPTLCYQDGAPQWS